MDEIEPVVKTLQGYAIESNSSSFDNILPKKPVQLQAQANKIPYQTPSGTTYVIELKRKEKNHGVILRACLAGFQSDWFSEISERSKSNYFDSIRQLFDWINASNYKPEEGNRYKILKEYEAYRMNVQGLRKSPLETINVVIKEGLICRSFIKSELEYLEVLLSLSKPMKSGESIPISLTSWFEMPWLRAEMDESLYLRLESPRLLLQSFRVTIATTLLWLLEQRKRWKNFPLIPFEPGKKNWPTVWNRMLLERIGDFNERSEPVDDFNQLIWLDLVIPSAQEALKSKMIESFPQDLPCVVYFGSSKNPPWQKPVFFHPNHQTRYSPLEELLCAWLAGCEAIQSSDIQKLKSSNYSREYNRQGRLLAMECTYYKGRAATAKQPAILMGHEPWTRAMEAYMTGLSEPHLFKTNIVRSKNFLPSGKNKPITLLYKIWKLPGFQKKLKAEMKKSESTHLFLQAMLELEKGDCLKSFHQTGKTTEEYEASVPRLLPRDLFSLTHIKTTAVHAGADAYRDADLVNHHSHTSLTEKVSYLTDKNKEWVNQSGRITRLVLHDLQNVVFQPSISTISCAVKDMETHTRLVAATHTQDIKQYSFKRHFIEYADEGEIVVSDIEDTAIYFLHYISQAEIMLPKLLAVRPDWVERTLIVQVEWMTSTLSRMRTASIAKKSYIKLAEHLPPLFDHILETIE